MIPAPVARLLIMNLTTPMLSLAVGALVATLSAAGQAPTASAASARLGSTVFLWEDLTAKPTGTGSRRDVADQPTATLEKLECHVSTLNPGLSSHPPHRHPQEEFIIVKEGRLEVFINGRVQQAGPGSLLFFAANDLHNMRNIGAGPATYLVFQITTAATRGVPDRAAADSAAPGALRSGVFDWATLGVKPAKNGARRDVVDAPTVTCTRFACHATTLNPGADAHQPHRHPDEEIVVVKVGRVQVTTNHATKEAGPGSIVFFGSNDLHGLKNGGVVPATYFVIRIVTSATPAPAGA